jgi:hypothetical protein
MAPSTKDVIAAAATPTTSRLPSTNWSARRAVRPVMCEVEKATATKPTEFRTPALRAKKPAR